MTTLLPIVVSAFGATAQTVLFYYHFNASPLTVAITSDGTLSTTKTFDGVCSQGATTSVTHTNAVVGFVIKIVTADDRVVVSFSTALGANITITNVVKLPVGNYLVVMQNRNVKMVSKFIKQ